MLYLDISLFLFLLCKEVEKNKQMKIEPIVLVAHSMSRRRGKKIIVTPKPQSRVRRVHRISTDKKIKNRNKREL